MNYATCLTQLAEQEVTREPTSAIGLALLKFGIVNTEINKLQREMVRTETVHLTAAR